MAEREVIWGTGALETSDSFTGKVVSTRWETGKEEYGSRDTWIWEVEPTSYEGSNRPIFYRASAKRRSVWGHLQESLEKMKLITPSMKGDPPVEGKEFEFRNERIFFGKNRQTGEDIEADATLPVRLVSATKGAKAESTEPSGDVESWVLEKVASEAVPLEQLYSAGQAQKFSKAQVLKAVKSLEGAGKVINDEGIVLAA